MSSTSFRFLGGNNLHCIGQTICPYMPCRAKGLGHWVDLKLWLCTLVTMLHGTHLHKVTKICAPVEVNTASHKLHSYYSM